MYPSTPEWLLVFNKHLQCKTKEAQLCPILQSGTQISKGYLKVSKGFLKDSFHVSAKKPKHINVDDFTRICHLRFVIFYMTNGAIQAGLE